MKCPLKGDFKMNTFHCNTKSQYYAFVNYIKMKSNRHFKRKKNTEGLGYFAFLFSFALLT